MLYKSLGMLREIKKELEEVNTYLNENRKHGSHPGDYPEEYFSHSDWDCPNSPTKFCMYTNDEDSCIFCYQPWERK